MSSAILREQPAPLPPRVPAALRAVILRCLAKDTAQRFARSSEVRASLETIQSSEETIPVERVVLSRKFEFSPRRIAVLGATIVALAAILFAWNPGGWRNRFAGSSAEAPIRSLAVLPMKNLNPAGSEDVLGLGMAETIITKVSQIGALTVRPTSAVQKYAKQEIDALEAARQLGVDSVLDGTVQRSGDRLRVNVNLLRVRDGASLWSDTFNVSANDLFATQDEIAQKVASGLRFQLNATEQAGIAKRYTSNPQAYDYFVKGMQYFAQRNLTRGSRSGLDPAITMFQRALELDPKYALAQAQLAYCYTWIALFNDPSNTSWWEHAKQALEKARSIDPNLAELHVVRYEQLWSRYEGFQIEAAVRELQEAQRLNPAVGHDALGILYAHMGLEEPAVRETQRAIEIDPTSEIAQSRFREIYDLFYRPEKAIEVRALYPNPAGTPSYIRKSYLWKGMFSEARREVDELLAQNPQDSVGLSAKALIFALQGDLGAARKAIPVMDEDSRKSRAYHHSTYNIACIYAVLGDAANTVKWLRETVDTGMPNYTLFFRDPHLDKIRKDPAFVQFMAGLKPRFEKYQQDFR